MDNQDIIHRINLLLNEKGISKQDFYNECGISSAAFSQWNTGKTSPKAKSLNKIASYLDTTVEYLISGTKQKKPAAETGDEPNILLDGFPLTQDEVRLLSQYRALNRQGKEYILQTLDMVVDRYKKDDTVSDVAAPNVG